MTKLKIILFLLLKTINILANTEAVGFYRDGRLLNGEDILSRDGMLRKLFTSRKRMFGTTELNDAIVDLANESTFRFKNLNQIQIGDLSNVNGGSARPNHQSHQNGLDADIVYFPTTNIIQNQNANYWEEIFVRNGRVTNNFNSFRNWEMFKFLVNRGGVNRIFVDTAIKREICRYAREIGELNNFIYVHRRIRPSDQFHKTHFHLRMKCPKGDNRCRDQAEPPNSHGC